MSDFGQKIVEIAKAYEARIRASESKLEEFNKMIEEANIDLEDHGFTTQEKEIGDRIIKTVNSNQDVIRRKQTITDKYQKFSVYRMVGRSLLLVNSSYEIKTEGNNFSVLAKITDDLSREMKKYRSAACLRDQPEIFEMVDALSGFFKTNDVAPNKGNFFSHEFARTILRTWNEIGYNTSLTLSKDDNGKKIPVTGFGVFLDAVEKEFDEILSQQGEDTDFRDAKGLRNAIQLIKSGRLPP